MRKSPDHQLIKYFGMAMKDNRLSNSYRNLYLAILICWKEQSFPDQIKVTRKDLMGRSKIASSSTYHLAIKRLVDLRYIVYSPTYDSYEGTSVQLFTNIKTSILMD
ncbi:hypothetical protein ABIE26_004464 [Pedobacter africanus]|uniref:Uncharacterized protein n=1 Tax=Pedobacter africanus TaxID=151894 RepID=A0ACC6L3K6_9SPHI|nr:hypothetical protein [Pedobacter africanus]